MGEPSDRFAVEFPYEGDFDVVDLSFQAEALRPGQNTDRFNMSVSVRTASGGRPPSFVVRAGRGESGSASLVREGDTYRLTAKGENSQGTFTLAVTCEHADRPSLGPSTMARRAAGRAPCEPPSETVPESVHRAGAVASGVPPDPPHAVTPRNSHSQGYG